MTSRSHLARRPEMKFARGFGVAAHTVCSAPSGAEGDDSQRATVCIGGDATRGFHGRARRPIGRSAGARLTLT